MQSCFSSTGGFLTVYKYFDRGDIHHLYVNIHLSNCRSVFSILFPYHLEWVACQVFQLYNNFARANLNATYIFIINIYFLKNSIPLSSINFIIIQIMNTMEFSLCIKSTIVSIKEDVQGGLHRSQGVNW